MRPRKLAVAVAAVVEAVVVVTIAGPCGAEQLHDAVAAGGGYKAVQLRDPEDEAESLERPKLNFAVFLLLQEGAMLLNE